MPENLSILSETKQVIAHLNILVHYVDSRQLPPTALL